MSNQLQITGEAKIRDLQGPVVSNSGVISALDGDASQYVRGDGTLADFPTSTGGGSSVSYYLNTSVSQGTIGGVAYKQLSKVPISGAGTDVTISANGYIASYLTDANDPALLEVPAGNFNCEFYFSVNSNAHNPYVYAELYKYDGTTFTLLGSNQAIPEYLTNGTTLSAYYFAIPVATSVLTITDRIAVRIYVNVDGRTVTLHTENNHLCQVVTTFSKGLTTLNSLTRQVQFFQTGTSGTDFAISSSVATHTFNLPVASASNTGKLSSTDWSTFNGKVPYTGATANVDLGLFSLKANGILAYGNGTAGGIVSFTQTGTLAGVATGAASIGSVSAGKLNIYFGDAGLEAVILDNSLLTADRTYNFPNASGTLAILEASIQVFSGTVQVQGQFNTVYGISMQKGSTPTSFSFGDVYIYAASGTANILKIANNTYTSTLSFPTSNQTYTYPAADGTLALTSNLSSYVPYTGATANVNLGIYQIISNGGDFRAQGANNPIGLILSSDYVVISNPKTIYTSYGQSTILGGHEFRSVNGSGTGSITSFYLNPSGAATFYYSVTANSIIKSGGTSSQYLMADGSISTLTNPITGTGTTNYVSKFTASGTIGDTVIYDNGTNVTIGGTASLNKLTVQGGTFTLNTPSSYALGVANGGGGNDLTLGTSTTYGAIQTWSEKPLVIQGQGNNVLIGTTTNSTFKLDVSGTFRVSGVATFGSTLSNGTFTYTLPSATGTLALTSALSDYLPLIGGSLTGNLFGTGGSFTGGITSYGGINLNGYTNSTGANFVEIGTTSTSYIIAAINRTTGNYNYPLSIDAQKLIINSTSGGDVAIGIGSPSSRLHIKQSTSSQGLYVESQSNDSQFRFAIVGTTESRITSTYISTGSYLPITFVTSDVERMRISAAGIVTTPYQVSFKAYLTSNPTLTKSSWNILPYTGEDYDTQGNFSTSTYKFTAPVAGKYLFTANLNIYGLDDTAQLTAAFVLNSSSYLYIYNFANLPTGNTGDTNISGSNIFNLSAGNTVDFRVYTDGSGSFFASGGITYGSFSGHLLG